MNQMNWALLIPPQVGRVSCGMGKPGLGKTEWFKGFGHHVNRDFSQLILGQCMPEDIGGIPTVVTLEDGSKVIRKIPMEEFMRNGFLLLDELTNTPHSVQAAALERVRLACDDQFVVCMANPAECATNYQGLTSAMVNRMVVVDVDEETMIHEWMTAMENDKEENEEIVFPMSEYPVVKPGWQRNRPFWAGMVVSFLKSHSEFCVKLPDQKEGDNVPWPSPRSWHTLALCMAGCDDVEANEATRIKLAKGCVGRAAGEGLLAHVRELKLTPPEEVLDQADTFKLPKAGDKALAICRMVMNYVNRHASPELLERMTDLAMNVWGQKQELGVYMWANVHLIYHNKLHGKCSPPKRTGAQADEIRRVMAELAAT